MDFIDGVPEILRQEPVACLCLCVVAPFHIDIEEIDEGEQLLIGEKRRFWAAEFSRLCRHPAVEFTFFVEGRGPS